MADETLKILIEGEDRATPVIKGIGQQAAGVFSGIVLAQAAQILGNAVRSIGTALQGLVIEAMAAQDVAQQTAAVLASTGGKAGMTAQAVDALAVSMQSFTRFEDETVAEGENLLLTFTNIGANIFPQATETMLDMSAALKQGVSASAVQLGKALQDPILGITALRRVGVNFTDSQKELIETLVKSGRTLDAQKIILKELQIEFGGSARAAGETLGGQLDILQNRLGNVREAFGGLIIRGIQPLVESINNNVMPAIEDFTQAFTTRLPEAFNTLAASGMTDIVKSMADNLRLGTGSALDLATAGNQAGNALAKAAGYLFIFEEYTSVVAAYMRDAFGALGQFIGGVFASTAQAIVAEFGVVEAKIRGISALARGDLKTLQQSEVDVTRLSGEASVALSGIGTSATTGYDEFDAATSRLLESLGTAAEHADTLRQAMDMPLSADPIVAMLNRINPPVVKAGKFIRNTITDAITDGAAAGVKGADAAFQKLIGKVGSMVSAAQSALGGLLGGTGLGGDPNAPGANGPFENIFRAADVAVHGAASPWAAKLGLDQATAQKIVNDFRNGLITGEVEALIDVGAMVNQLQMQKAAEAMTTAFTEKVAALAGVGKNTVLNAITGMPGGSLATVNATAATEATALSAAFTSQMPTFEQTGRDFLAAIGRGFAESKEALLTQAGAIAQALVDRMIATINAKPTGGGVRAGLGAGGVVLP